MSNTGIRDIRGMEGQELLTYLSTVKTKLVTNIESVHDKHTLCHKYFRKGQEYARAILQKKEDNAQTGPLYVSSRPWQQGVVAINMMLGRRAKLYSQHGAAVDELAGVALDYVNDVLYGQEEIDYQTKLQQHEADRCPGGTGIQKIFWKRTYKTIEVMEPYKIGTIPIPFTEHKVKKKVIADNTPQVEIVNPVKLFYDPTITEIGKQPSVCEEIDMLMSEMEAIVESGAWKKFDRQAIAGQAVQGDNTNEEEEREDGGVESYEVIRSDTHDPMIRVEQYWLKPKWLITIIAGGKSDGHVLEKIEHDLPEPPYVITPFMRVARRSPGVGVLENTLSTFDEINEWKGLRIGGKRRAYGEVLIVNKERLLKPDEQLTPSDSWVIEVEGDPDKAVKFGSPRTNDDMLKEEMHALQELETVGIPLALSGAGPFKGHETATGQGMLTSAAANKFEEPRENLERAIAKVANWICWYCSKHLVDGKEFYVREGAQWTQKYVDYRFFEDAQGSPFFKIKVEVGSTKPKDQENEQQWWIMLIKLLANDQSVYRPEMIRRLFESHEEKDIAKLLPPEPAVPLSQAKQMVQKTQAECQEKTLELKERHQDELIKARKTEKWKDEIRQLPDTPEGRQRLAEHIGGARGQPS